ncbi:MAG: MATE family efflux transporter [Burkholderiales bacterium]|nr:MATE family efflux transporter [Burkholderiales bacterium]
MKDLTQGPIPRHVAELSIPMAVGMLVQTLYYFIDLYFVAKLGDVAIAAVSSAGTVFFIALALTQVLSVATVALVSQAVGRKDQAEANMAFNQSVVMAALCTIGTLVVGYLLADPYMRLVGADEPTRAAGRTFLHWFIPGLALQFPMVVMSSGLRGTGIVKPGMIVQMVTVLINAVLAPVLIAGWGTGHPLGVAGAALATTVASAAGVILLAIYFVRLEKYVHFESALWRPRMDVWKRMLVVGLPAGGEFLLLGIFTGILYWITGRVGAHAQAGFGVASRIMQMIFLPAMAIAFSAAPLAGQNYGARRADRVRETFRVSVLASCVVMLAMTGLCQVAGEAMVRFFATEPEAIAVGTEFLRVISLNFFAMGIVWTCSSMFQGMGNTLPSLASSAMRLVTFAVPAIWMSLQPDFQLLHIWYLSVVTVLLQAGVSVWLLRREFAKRLGSDLVERGQTSRSVPK